MLYIIRHGKTQWNQANLLQGRSDFPLNDDGRQQAVEAARWMREHGVVIDKIYTSPLVRAIQTAKLLYSGEQTDPLDEAAPLSRNDSSDPAGPLVLEDRLIEMDYGPYEGMDLTKPAPEVLEFFRDFVNNPAPQGMESLRSVVDRLGSFLEEIRREAEQCSVLLSTHAIAMKGALEYLTPDSNGSYWAKYIANCAIYQVEVKDGCYGIPVEIYPV